MNISNSSKIAKDFLEKGYSRNCPILDMHAHFGHYWASYLPAADPDRMLEIIKRSGIKRIVCSSHQSLVDPDYGNVLMQRAINKYPKYLLGYWSINPNYQDIIMRDISNFHKFKGFVGFKFLSDYHFQAMNNWRYQRALEYANEHGLLVLMHTWGHSPYDSPEIVAEIAQKYPNIKFIMAHSGFGDWESAVSVAKDLQNVYLDLVAVVIGHDFSQLPGGGLNLIQSQVTSLIVNGIIEYFVENVSSKKILFGTDLPWHSTYFGVGAVLFSRIREEEKHDILHGNAEKLLENYL